MSYHLKLPSIAAAVALCTSAALAQRVAPPHPVIDSAATWRTLTELAADSMEGRAIGSRGNAAARALLVRRLQRAGLVPGAPAFEQRFPVVVRDTSVHDGANVVAIVPGADTTRFIVISAHYDHVGTRAGQVFNGADDNASGTAAALALAEWYAGHQPMHTMIFVFFDGEESGLRGARAFVAGPPNRVNRIAVNVNLDMVARLDKNELYAAGATPYPFLRPLLEATAAAAPVKLLLGHDSNDKGPGENWINQSDQGAFHAMGIPFVYFGVEDHPDYHRHTDEVERINPGRFIASLRTIADFVHRLDQSLDAVIVRR